MLLSTPSNAIGLTLILVGFTAKHSTGHIRKHSKGYSFNIERLQLALTGSRGRYTYTTENFRDNKPIAVWTNKTWNDLNQFGYEKIAFKLLKIEYNDLKTHAKIAIATKIKTGVGSAAQKERYLLIKEGDYWLIDELIVTDEKVDEEEFWL